MGKLGMRSSIVGIWKLK